MKITISQLRGMVEEALLEEKKKKTESEKLQEELEPIDE